MQPTQTALVRYLGAIDPTSPLLAVPVPHTIVVTAGLRRGRLAISVEHDASQASAAGTDQLAAALAEQLGRLLRDLADTAPRSPRPDDFGHVALDAQELDDLLGDLS